MKNYDYFTSVIYNGLLDTAPANMPGLATDRALAPTLLIVYILKQQVLPVITAAVYSILPKVLKAICEQPDANPLSENTRQSIVDGEPPSSYGAVQDITIDVEELNDALIMAVGKPGACEATNDKISVSGPAPTKFTAATVNLYVYPLVKPD